MIKEIGDTENKKYNSHLEEYARQLSFQAGLLAGFGFTGLTSVSFDTLVYSWIQNCYVVCVCLAIFLELTASILAGLLTFAARGELLRGGDLDLYAVPFNIAGICFVLGLLLLLAATTVVAWIKASDAAAIVTIAAVATFLLMLIGLYLIGSIATRSE